jgi:hypothetical protein
MNTALRLAGFGVGLLAVFGAAVGVGAAVAPAATPAAPAAAAAAPHGEDHTGAGATTTASLAGAATVPGGLMVSQERLHARPGRAVAARGTAGAVAV